MRYAEPASGGDTSELYSWLRSQEEAAEAAPGRRLSCWKLGEQPDYQGSEERLAALRVGQPVNVAASALPRWARPEGKVRWWHRAVVSADGSVEWVQDSGEWAAAQGL